MNIYTYYENIGHQLQNELLDIWQKSWEKYGYMYNQLKANDRIKSLSKSKGDIVIKFDINEIIYKIDAKLPNDCK